MKYEVRCECGNPHVVTAADAGASLACVCGRTVEVPPLHELRAATGEETLSPIVRLQTMLLNKQLPPSRECAYCGAHTGGLLYLAVECERAIVKRGGPSRASVVAGCVLSVPLALFMLLMHRNAPATQHGQDVVLTLPVPVCDACRPALDDLARLRDALRHIPEYASLLDRYQNARIALRR